MAKATEKVEAAPDDMRQALQGGRLTAEEANKRADAANPPPAQVVVKEDVYEDVADPYATTRRQALKFHKGQVITEAQAEQSGVKAVQQQDVRGGETK